MPERATKPQEKMKKSNLSVSRGVRNGAREMAATIAASVLFLFGLLLLSGAEANPAQALVGLPAMGAGVWLFTRLDAASRPSRKGDERPTAETPAQYNRAA